MKNFLRRLKMTWLVFYNDGVLIEFNKEGKSAILKVKEMPKPGDTLTVGNVTATFIEM